MFLTYTRQDIVNHWFGNSASFNLAVKSIVKLITISYNSFFTYLLKLIGFSLDCLT